MIKGGKKIDGTRTTTKYNRTSAIPAPINATNPAAFPSKTSHYILTTKYGRQECNGALCI